MRKLMLPLKAACRRFDMVPLKDMADALVMAKDELTGNMPTEQLASHFTAQKVTTGVRPMRVLKVLTSKPCKCLLPR